MSSRHEYRKALMEILPALEYAELQARVTFDPLVRSQPQLKGTPSVLTIQLQEALAKAREVLA